jgi:hypothetical protein
LVIPVKIKALEEEIIVMLQNNPIILDFLKSTMNVIKDGFVG